MDKIFFLILIFFISMIFYLGIPLLGNMINRKNWLRFRSWLLEVSLFPIVNYPNLKSDSGKLGAFRFFGTIEAIQGENRIWIKNGSLTLSADLEGVTIYMLPSISGYQHLASQDDYEALSHNLQSFIVKWDQLFPIPEGTQIFIGGTLFRENGLGIFRNEQNCPLLVIIYDGDESTILNRSMLHGRQRNEYWNQFTLISLISGMVIIFLISYFLLQVNEYRFIAIISISFGLLPIAIFLPPGVVLMYYYRVIWKKGRMTRIGRDLISLPLRFIAHSSYSITDSKKRIIILPDNSEYIMHRDTLDENRRLVKNPEQLKIRKCLYTDEKIYDKGETYLFGAFLENKDSYSIARSHDPMVELVLIPGNPEKIIESCNKSSLFYATFAVVLLFIDIVINFSIVFFILQFFF